MARPRLVIDPDQVQKLAAIDCSVAEIGAVLGCSADTLQRRYAAAIEKGRQEGCASLKRKQFELAMAGNATMLIWLGKQRLGQKDRQDMTSADQPLAFVSYRIENAAGEPVEGV